MKERRRELGHRTNMLEFAPCVSAPAAVERAPMNETELAWMRRVGATIRDATAKPSRVSFLGIADRIATVGSCGPKRLPG